MVPLSIKFNQKNNVIEDVLKKNDKVVYVLDENPSTDFRVDCSLHQLNGNSVLETNISIKLTAKDDSRSTLA